MRHRCPQVVIMYRRRSSIGQDSRPKVDVILFMIVVIFSQLIEYFMRDDSSAQPLVLLTGLSSGVVLWMITVSLISCVL